MKKIFTFIAAAVCSMSMFALTYNVTVPAGTNACYIAGEMNGWSQVEMTKVDDTHYTLDVADATDAMKYKYCSGPSWAYVEKTAAGGDVDNRAYSTNDVVEAWAAVYNPNATKPETKKIYLNTGGAELWNQADAKFFVHAWGESPFVDVQMTLVAGETDIYEAEINKDHNMIIFLRLAPTATAVVWDGADMWNKTSDLSIEGNCYTITSWEEGSWSEYKSATTSVESVATAKQATKLIYKGQVVLLRDGLMFNLLGQEVK